MDGAHLRRLEVLPHADDGRVHLVDALRLERLAVPRVHPDRRVDEVAVTTTDSSIATGSTVPPA